MKKQKLQVQSEIGELEAVILHTPGPEVENMTPQNAQRALYSDILNLSIAQDEYVQMKGVISKVAEIYEVKDLLEEVLDDVAGRENLMRKICAGEDLPDYFDIFMSMDSKELSTVLIEGFPTKVNTLTSFMKNDYYALKPLYNFYFTRDSSVTIGGNALICRMANKVREREAIIMDAIFECSGKFDCGLYDLRTPDRAAGEIFIEGGDVLVAREDILLIGNGLRTSTQGVDSLVSRLCREEFEGKRHILVQQLPDSPESFIHLDMVFTFLDRDKCLVYEPLIMRDNRYQTVHITIENGKVTKIRQVSNLTSALKRLGMELQSVVCGGSDEWNQEREQWHSGANSFAFAPGKVLVYARNVHTLEQLDKHGFDIMTAADVISGKSVIGDGPCAVTIAGSELPRGGGGARCMTMPVSRRKVLW